MDSFLRLLDFVMIPLAVVGAYQIFRGVLYVIEKDVSEKDWRSGWTLKGYIALTLLGCFSVIGVFANGQNDNSYEKGYEAGYSSGCSDTRIEMEDDFSRGYEEGSNDAVVFASSSSVIHDYPNMAADIVREYQADANYYASENSEYDTETAMGIVDSYLNNTPDSYGEWHTQQEFEDAVLTLYKFYEYFYSDRYK